MTSFNLFCQRTKLEPKGFTDFNTILISDNTDQDPVGDHQRF